MRKMTNILALSILGLTMPSLTVSCTFRKYVSGKDGIFSVPDADWSLTNNYDMEDRSTEILSGLTQSNELQVIPDYNDDSMNWNNISTGYRDYNQIRLQSASGVPIENNYNLTGNVKSDYGFSGLSSTYTRINSILNWSPENNADAKYSKATVPLQKREAVGEKWTETQNKNIKMMNMGRQYDGRFNGVDGNQTITGQQKINQQSFNNWQYVDSYVWWRGMIGIPPGQFTDYAHTNGTKSIGILYLDGFYGLKPGMILDLLKKDANGKYLIVNKLIEIAKYYGFDGWFINEEANGAFIEEQPVLKFSDMKEIMAQFKEQAAGDNIDIDSYTNSGTLEYNNEDQPMNMKSTQYALNSDSFLTDFGDNAYSNEKYSADNGIKSSIPDDKSSTYDKETKTNFNVYNMWDFGSVRDALGKYKPAPSKDVFWDKLALNSSLKAMNSLAIFGAHAGWENAQDYFTPNADDDIGKDIQRIQKTEDDDVRLYTGNDRNLTGSWYEEAIKNDLEGSREGYKDKSFGAGNLVQEKTTIINGVDTFKTSFSIGQGKKWIDTNFNSLNESDGYTWSNKSLADVQPTYKWDIFKTTSKGMEPIAGKTDKNGFYDFDEVYEKGNSIALGSTYYNDQKHEYNGGKIMDSPFIKNQDYGWDIMGSNLTDDFEYNIGLTFKVSSNDKKNVPDDLLKEIQNQGISLLLNDEVHDAIVTDANNGWSTLNIKIKPSEMKPKNLKLTDNTPGLYKIGVQIDELENDTKFKLNVGQITINKADRVSENNEVKLTDFKSEYVIIRNDTNKLNIRMNWNVSEEDIAKVDYYEVYYKLNNKIYRYGETGNDAYWMGDINIENILQQQDKKIEIMIRPIVYEGPNLNYTTIKLDLN